ncbi:MAG: hypothetical protein IJW59_03370 [Clostridia bacterium]|nr:hypothetical protein [Clostridia bacterium]
MFSRNKVKIISDAICGIIMLLSILAFVLIGVFGKIWHPTWIILVIAIVVDAVLSIVVGATIKVKKQNPNESEEI